MIRQYCEEMPDLHCKGMLDLHFEEMLHIYTGICSRRLELKSIMNLPWP